jgi:hypothetical protein
MEDALTGEEIRKRAFAMPITNPAYLPGHNRFLRREYLIITYRTDPVRLRAIVPEPLALDAPLVKYEFIRMPDSTGFGDYTGRVISVSLNGSGGSYTHCMFVDDESAIAGGRELWGFPKKLASPSLNVENGSGNRRGTHAGFDGSSHSLIRRQLQRYSKPAGFDSEFVESPLEDRARARSAFPHYPFAFDQVVGAGCPPIGPRVVVDDDQDGPAQPVC